MKAIVLQGQAGKASLVFDRPSPKLRPGYILVYVKAVALNPTDWKHVDLANEAKGTLFGCDYAGIVAETGTGYSTDWKTGDKICGFSLGGNKLQQEDGAFAETIVVKADVQMRIPNHLSFEEAATVPTAILTCGQGLFQEMGLTWPKEASETSNNEPILIYGGSSTTGLMGIQLVKLAGYVPLTTCSPHNFELVKSLGAFPVDYKDPNCTEQIRQAAGNNLRLVWDTISTHESAKICAKVIDPGGICGTVRDVAFPRTGVRKTRSSGYTSTGEPVEKPGMSLPAQPEHFVFTKKWMKEAESLLQRKLIKPPPSRVGKGLECVLDGVDLLRNGKVSGVKLVYTL
ncbi:uncharacterized protein A1O9_11741 [Exophiala aquamarina CBS 119918]|uniref:Enoyl reductase (ER) domain-containing protein n=1 Tax=Exophiala aquamarina CBS 119918 TaxID=1182545 RepID=A0A072P945_9EURO|nr:uncharacterized protein A1O9_11741 [Exophiala aquamarina CBS 119918]KEF52115.1 hypothetical protein A1O9_11741 [Exophiala aquamarina CBS 119918]